MNFEGLVVLVTGASRGIGKTLCNILNEYGATVVGIYNNTLMDDVLFDTYKCDISNEFEIKNVIDKVILKHEKINVLVNCAAISIDDDLYEKTKNDFMKVIEVNLVGTFLMCKYVSLYMNRGVIINVSSTDASTTYNPLSIDYAASKAGVNNMTLNLSERLNNIKICAIEPNWVNTESVLEMDPKYLEDELKRVGQKKLLTKEEVAFKIIEMIINDDIVSGTIVKMGGINE